MKALEKLVGLVVRAMSTHADRPTHYFEQGSDRDHLASAHGLV